MDFQDFGFSKGFGVYDFMASFYEGFWNTDDADLMDLKGFLILIGNGFSGF